MSAIDTATRLPQVVKVSSEHCVNCHMCISVCPVKYCNDGSGDYVNVNPDTCIGCGRCVMACTHGARLYCDDTECFLSDLAHGEPVVAIVAPSVAANFPDQYLHLNGWLQSLGIDAVFDVSFGAELTARSYVELLRTGQDQTIIAQPCPVVVSYIQIYRPNLISRLAPVDSPMLHLMKMIRRYHPEYAHHRIAAISPCLAKKREFQETALGDYNVTFLSIKQHLEADGIDLARFPAAPYVNPAPERAVLFPTPGGLMHTVERWVPDVANRTRKIEGEHGVYRYLGALDQALEEGKPGLPLLVDCLNCAAGCNMGPASVTGQDTLDEVEYRVEQRKQALQAAAEADAAQLGEAATETLSATIESYWDPALYRRQYRDLSGHFTLRVPTAAQRDEIFHRMHKHSEQDMFNCSACGYERCESMCLAIFNNLNRVENCHHYLMRERTQAQETIEQNEQRLSTILDTSLEGFIQVDSAGRLTELNESMRSMFGRPREDLIGASLPDLLEAESSRTVRHQLTLRDQDRTSRYEITIEQPGGKLLHCLCHGSPLYGLHGQRMGSFAMVTDTGEANPAPRPPPGHGPGAPGRLKEEKKSALRASDRRCGPSSTARPWPWS